MQRISREKVPCWFELSWDKKAVAIILRIHKKYLDTWPEIRPDLPIIEATKREFKFSSFSSDIRTKDFGFEGVFRYAGENADFISLNISLPKILSLSGKLCTNCNGAGRLEHPERRCSRCHGKGKEIVYDWHSAYALSATFSFFGMFSVSPFQEITYQALPQLLTVRTITQAGQHGGGSLGGEYSSALCKWVANLPANTSIDEVELAMVQAYQYMFKLPSFGRLQFQASHRGDGIFCARCPGDACEIRSPYLGDGKVGKEGTKFNSNNVDSPLQQLTFIVGLAALHDKARKEIVTY